MLPQPRSVTLRPEWLAWSGGTVPALAREIDAAGMFDRLPELAEALELAGCDEAAILEHLRCGSPHYRGCWVLDRLMGR